MFFKRFLRNLKKVKCVNGLIFNLDNIKRSYYKKYKRNVFIIRFIPTFILLFFIKPWLLGLLFGVLWFVLSTIFFDHRKIVCFTPTIRIWFGVPGSGKTSVAAWLTAHSLLARQNVLSNVPIDFAYILRKEDLGVYDMSFNGEGAHVIYDEAGLDFDSRLFKAFSKTENPRYFATHRHMINRVDVFSQAVDVDKKIRDRTEVDGMYHLIPLHFKGFVMYRNISKIIYLPNPNKGEFANGSTVVEGFKYRGLPRICFTMPVWDSFNTFDMSVCPQLQKTWHKWNELNS